MRPSFVKDPGARLPYTHDWTDWLNGETIVTSTWTADAGIVIASISNDATTASVVLSGGTVGVTYKVVNRITVADISASVEERTIMITVANR